MTQPNFLEGDLLHLSEIVVHPEGGLRGQTVGDLEQDLDLSIVFHQRDRVRDMHPLDELELKSEDKVVVFCSLEQLNLLEQLNCPSRGRLRRPRRPSWLPGGE